jgi:predicted ester cyclase
MTEAETNKEIIRRYQDACNRNELDFLDEVLDPNWVTNGWVEGTPQSIQAAKDVQQELLKVFPDLHYETLDLFAEGEQVAQRWMARATHAGEFAGFPPTGRQIEVSGISIFRLVRGRIVEHWTHIDEFGLYEQVGWKAPEAIRVYAHGTPR